MQQALKAKNTDSKASVKIFQREQRSLFGEILDWMLTPLLLLWPVSLALTWLVAQSLANKPFDRALEYNVHALAQLILVDAGGQLHFNLPQPASEMLRADESDMVLFQVTTSDGSFLAGDSDFPSPPHHSLWNWGRWNCVTMKSAAWTCAWLHCACGCPC